MELAGLKAVLRESVSEWLVTANPKTSVCNYCKSNGHWSIGLHWVFKKVIIFNDK